MAHDPGSGELRTSGADGSVRKPGAAERFLPVGIYLLTLAVAAALLPTALRPPPEDPTTSAEFSPDAPPDDETQDAILSALRRGGSGTAGAGTEAGEVAGPTGLPREVERLALGHCFGNPPRQFESLYAAECRPRFVGDNGGKTYKNVTRTEIRLGIWHSTSMPATRGEIADEPADNDGAAIRTHRVLQRYWNRHYELYGRRLQLVALPNGNGEEGTRATAVDADDVYRVFAATHLRPGFCDELVRRGLVCYIGDPIARSVHRAHDPLWWGYQMATDQNEELVAELVCNQLVGGDAEFAGGAEQGQPRRFGVVVQSSSDTDFRTTENFERTLRRTCGVTATAAELPNPTEDGSAGAAIASAIARFRLDGVTTIVNYTTLLTILPLMQAADSNSYFPEWVWSGEYGLDFNDIGRLLPQSQMVHAFGFSGWEVPLPFPQTECYRAYKSFDPDNTPDESVCRLFFHRVMHVVNGIQNAGPNLNPDTFKQGMYDYAYRTPSAPHAIWGGYGPGDWSWMDTMGAIWWDPTATDPAGGEPGAFRWLNRGRRYGNGEVPTDPLPFFDGGVTTTG